MPLTDYHAKYFAHELTKRCPSDSPERFAGALVDAKVDLNPHQIEAALFAFRSPLSRGALLADEVGLGKTIEAGLVLSQKWAERKRRILIITAVQRYCQHPQNGPQGHAQTAPYGHTPQNSLLELFGLVSVIDQHAFGDLKSFRDLESAAHRATDRPLPPLWAKTRCGLGQFLEP